MITFTKDFEIGVRKIDEQHRELINRLNAVVAAGSSSASKDETEKTLRLLIEYVDKHFADEEALQKSCGYPKFEWHKSQHELYKEEIRKLNNEFMQNGPSTSFTLNLNKSIIDWIIKHIRYTDVEIANYCKD